TGESPQAQRQTIPLHRHPEQTNQRPESSQRSSETTAARGVRREAEWRWSVGRQEVSVLGRVDGRHEKRGLAPNCIRASDSASKRPGHHRIARFIAVQRTIVSGRFREEEVLDVSKKALAQLNVTPRGGYFERRTNGWNRPRPDIWRP